TCLWSASQRPMSWPLCELSFHSASQAAWKRSKRPIPSRYALLNEDGNALRQELISTKRASASKEPRRIDPRRGFSPPIVGDRHETLLMTARTNIVIPNWGETYHQAARHQVPRKIFTRSGKPAPQILTLSAFCQLY